MEEQPDRERGSGKDRETERWRQREDWRNGIMAAGRKSREV